MKNYTGEPVTFIEIENGIIIDTIIIESDGLLDKETDPIPEGNDYVLVTREYRDLKRSDKDCWKLLIPISPYFEKDGKLKGYTATERSQHKSNDPRPLYKIAQEIEKLWGPRISKHAKPYIEAMLELVSIEDMFYYDSASDIVARFLCNANHWRGEDARRIKKELKTMLK